MDITFPELWVERKLRKECIAYAAPSTGLRVKFADGIDPSVKSTVNNLISYLRKRYYFPIRCNIKITNHVHYRSEQGGHVYYGVFYDNEKLYQKKRVYPEIYVAGCIKELWQIEQLLFTLLHELSHYYQWFFNEGKNRSDRSLEIEANKWANRILQEFMQKCTLCTPFGALNIYLDDQIVDYLPIATVPDYPVCKHQPLAACYRIFGAIKTGQTVRVVVEPLQKCKSFFDSGENYVCCVWQKSNLEMTIGTIDYYDDNAPYEVRTLNNGLELIGIANESTVVIGVAWVNDYDDGDNRTYFAADPS